MTWNERSPVLLSASQRGGPESVLDATREGAKEALGNHSTTSNQHNKGTCSWNCNTGVISQEEGGSMSCRVITTGRPCMYRGGSVAESSLTFVSGEAPESQDVLQQEAHVADLKTPVAHARNLGQDNTELIREEIQMYGVTSEVVGGKKHASEASPVDMLVSKGTANRKEITSSGAILNAASSSGLAQAQDDSRSTFSDSVELRVPCGVGASSYLIGTATVRSSRQISSDEVMLPPSGASCEPGGGHLFQEDSPLDPSSDRLLEVHGDSARRVLAEFRPSSEIAAGRREVATSAEMTARTDGCATSRAPEPRHGSLMSHAERSSGPRTPASPKKRDNATVVSQQDTILETETLNSAADRCKYKSPWRQPIVERYEAAASGRQRQRAEAKSGTAETALAELELELRARHQEAECQLAVSGARVKLMEMAFDEAHGRAYTAGELLRRKEAALGESHPSSESITSRGQLAGRCSHQAAQVSWACNSGLDRP